LKFLIQIFQTEQIEQAVDQTWVASLICPDQMRLIANHPSDKPLYVDGEYSVHLREEHLKYFILREEPDLLLDSGSVIPAPYYEEDCELFELNVDFSRNSPDRGF
jgi:C-terminal domain of the ECSIT protein